MCRLLVVACFISAALAVCPGVTCCPAQTSCDSCTANFGVLAGCVWCPSANSNAGACMDPVTAVRSCPAVQFNSNMCASSETVPTNVPSQRSIAIEADCATGNTCTFVSASVGSGTAAAIVFRGVKGGVVPQFADLPAVNVKAASVGQGEGVSFFDFGMVVEGINEWNDANGDGIVQAATELLTPGFNFNAGYAWEFETSHGGGLYTITLTGTYTAHPTLVVNCTLPDKDNLEISGFTVSATTVKCDLDITGLALTALTNNWCLKTFSVSGTSETLVGIDPAVAGAATRSVAQVNLGLGGSFSWIRLAGRTAGALDVNVTYSGETGSGVTYTGTGSVAVAQNFFGFINPSPGTQFPAIFWDPQIEAPSTSAAVSVLPSMFIFFSAVVAFLRL